MKLTDFERRLLNALQLFTSRTSVEHHLAVENRRRQEHKYLQDGKMMVRKKFRKAKEQE